MVETVARVFETEDIKRIKNGAPASPCTSCASSLGCCGCPRYYDWRAKYEVPLKEAGVFEYARQYEEVKASLEEGIWNLRSDYKRLKNLEAEIKEIAPQVLGGLVSESAKLLTDLMDKYLQLEKELGNTPVNMGDMDKETEEERIKRLGEKALGL